jgi:hypothetical protein
LAECAADRVAVGLWRVGWGVWDFVVTVMIFKVVLKRVRSAAFAERFKGGLGAAGTLGRDSR